MKRKKEKIVYIDDGRPLADLSGVRSAGFSASRRPHTSVREILATYWAAVKMMFLPMLVVVGAMCLVYAVAALLFYIF